MLKIIICDDDMRFLQEAESVVKSSLDKMMIPAQIMVFNNSISLINYFEIHENPCDILFMDIDIPTLNGMKTVERLYKLSSFYLIFLTSHDEEVYNAFTYNARDFILKSYLPQKITSSLERAISDVEQKQNSVVYFDVETNNRISEHIKIYINDILYFYSNTRKIYLKTIRSKEYVIVHQKFSDLISCFLKKDFLKIHRLFLINPRHIRLLKANCVLLENGDELPLARGQKQKVIDALFHYSDLTDRSEYQ